MAGLASHALTVGGADAAAAAFAVAAAAIVVLMFGLALALSLARERLVDAMQRGAPVVKQWSGYLLIGVGLWLIALAVFVGFFADLFPV